MTPVLVTILIALVAAGLVLVLAGRLTTARPGTSFVADLRSGLRGGGPRGLWSATRREHAEAAAADADGLVDLLRAASSSGPAYLQVGDVAEHLTGRRPG